MTDPITDFLPTEAEHFKARYTRWIGIVTLAGGIINVLLFVWLILLTGRFNVQIIVGVMLTFIGFKYLTGSYFSVAPNRISVYNRLGSAVKRYTFASFSDLSIKNNKVYVKDAADGSERKVNIAKWLTHPKDWEALHSMTETQE